MKKIFLLVFLSVLIISTANAKCDWHIFASVYNDGIVVEQYNKYDLSPFVASIGIGDSVKLNVGGNPNCFPNELLLLHGDDTLFNGDLQWHFQLIFSLTDTGQYHIDYFFDMDHWIYDINVSYLLGTSIQNNSTFQTFQLLPTLSTGLLKLVPESEKMKYLQIMDGTGRIVFSAVNPFSEINLTRFSPGMYYYAIIDEKENSWRGRVIIE